MADSEISRVAVLGRVDDFPASGLREVEVDGQTILLVKRGDEVSAIQGICPHAGASLAAGVLDGERVICPWHKAAFSVRTGACVAPPAVDDLKAFDIEIVDGDIVLGRARAPETLEKAATDARCFAIVGAGGAGFAAAQTLRAEGFGGRVVLIDATGDLPYDRTILSKYVLAGKKAGEKSPLQDEEFYERHGIERVAALVTGLDARAKRIVFADGATLDYDAALVATGGAARPLDVPGGDLANVFVLRSREDAERIVAAAAGAKRCVVIGASFIGMEAAAGLRQRGLDVTVVGQESAPFDKQLGADVGNVYRKIHEEQGVKFRLGEKVGGLMGEGAVRAVRLAGGDEIAADLVVAGLGIVPATDFVTGAERGADNGLLVDARLRAADELYAAGDVAAFPLRGDGETIRVEHWRVAEQHGRVAALNMLGRDVVYDSVPVFWTIQYMKRLDYVGHASSKDDVLVRGDLGKQEFIAYYLRDGLVAAAAGMNRDQDMAAIIALMEAERNWLVEDLHPEGTSPVAVLAARQG
jgi:NADPH-dependent 2,4-dienoyl-CoA reductase/sulfur reductase-like enzyme/nitrite reductase/ring-hydroxylating ferredoxin subunit